MKWALALVEGQTEERFVKAVMNPALEPNGLFITPTILVTKVVKTGPNFKGGVSNYAKFRSDILRLLHGAGDRLVTTLLDYYALPNDFPGMSTRHALHTPLERVQHVEGAVAADLGNPPQFLPFLALHEFEAWLFSSVEHFARALTRPDLMPQLAHVLNECGAPEMINERPTHAPSKRILELYPAYQKTLHGPAAAQRIGLEAISNSCPHFREWIQRLKHFADS